MNFAFVLVLIYSPVSPYFNGFTFEVRTDMQTCLAEIEYRIGETPSFSRPWEPQMQGPAPKVIGGFCAQGGFAPGAK